MESIRGVTTGGGGGWGHVLPPHKFPVPHAGAAPHPTQIMHKVKQNGMEKSPTSLCTPRKSKASKSPPPPPPENRSYATGLHVSVICHKCERYGLSRIFYSERNVFWMWYRSTQRFIAIVKIVGLQIMTLFLFPTHAHTDGKTYRYIDTQIDK